MGFIRQTTEGSEYAGGGYGVVVKSDGAINVKAGDSLSKYSMAIYGDFELMDKKFGRRVGGQVKSFQELGANINLIQAGETLYHMSRHNTHVPGAPATPVVPSPEVPDAPQSELQRRAIEAIEYIQKVMWIGSGWEVTGSDGVGVGVNSPGFKLGGALNGMRFWVKRPQDTQPVTMWGVTAGGSLGIAPDPLPVEISFSTSDFPSAGAIVKSPTSGATLSKSELSGLAVSIEIGGHIVAGGSVIAILGGPSIYEFFTNPVRSTAQLCMAKWCLVSAGGSVLTGADLSVTVSGGYFHAI